MSPKEQGWTGGRERDRYTGPSHHHPSNLPLGGSAHWSGGSTSSFQWLRLMDVRPGRRPPPAAAPLGSHPGKALDGSPDSHGRALRRGAGSRGALGFRHSLSQAGCPRARRRSEPGPRHRRSPKRCRPVCQAAGEVRAGAVGGGGPRERTHHDGRDWLARDVGHLASDPATECRSATPAAKTPAAAPYA